MDKEERRQLKSHILGRFGGPNAVAEICGVSISAISQWDIVPATHQMTLYRYAQETGMEFCAEEFHVIPKKQLSHASFSNDLLTMQSKRPIGG